MDKLVLSGSKIYYSGDAVAEVIRINKSAAYQELLVDRYIEDIMRNVK